MLDPNGLIVSEEYDWIKISDIDVNYNTWEDVLSACKTWANAKEYGEVFCCQHTMIEDKFSTSLDAFVVKTSKVVAQEKMEFSYPGIGIDPSTVTFYAQITDSASRLGGVTAIFATAVLMN